ncbi:MAG: beta-propeller fold lactonase family protein [Acidobacteria bacterium]|nr:beta-propeller fold lactonase family protein [Acidobacteriota bacterium]
MKPDDSTDFADTSSRERLESWKEIAAYLKRDIRTIQRWEKTEHLPVHRHWHSRGRSVYAFKNELDEWLKGRQGADAFETLREDDDLAPPAVAARKKWPAWAAATSTALVLLFIGLVWQASVTEESALPKISRLLASATSENGQMYRIAVGKTPVDMVITHDGEELYVSNSGEDSVSVIRTSTGTVTHTLQVGRRPETLALSPDGSHIYVANVTGSLSIIDATTKSVNTLTTDAPLLDLAVTPDNRAVYLTHVFSGMSRLWVREKRFEPVPVSKGPAYVTPSNDGSRLYINYQGGGSRGREGHDSIDVIRTTDHQVIATIDGLPNVGGWLSLSPDGSQIWANGNDACIAPAYDHTGCPTAPSAVINIIRTSDNSLVKTLSFSLNDGVSRYVSFFPDSSHAIVGGGNTKIIDTQTFTITETIPLAGTGRFVFSRDHRRAYYLLDQDNSVAVLDVPAGPCFSPPLGLVGWWPGDGNSNDIRNINHAVLSGGSGFAPGRSGQAFRLDGRSGTIELGTLSNLTTIMNDEFTVAVSVKVSSGTGAQTEMVIADRMPADPALDGWRLLKDTSNRITFCLGRGPSICERGAVVVSQPVALDRWFDVEVVKSRTSISLFVDGGFQAKTSAGASAQTIGLPLRFGSTGTGGFLDGLIDEIQLYSRPLSESEISGIHAAATHYGCFPSS